MLVCPQGGEVGRRAKDIGKFIVHVLRRSKVEACHAGDDVWIEGVRVEKIASGQM